MFICWWFRKFYEKRVSGITQYGRNIIIGWDGIVHRGGKLKFRINVQGHIQEIFRPIEMPPMVRIQRINKNLIKITLYCNKREESSVNGNYLIEDTESPLYEATYYVKTGIIWRVRQLSK